MHIDNINHGFLVGEPNVMEKTAPQESVRQFLFIVTGNDDDRAVFCAYCFFRFVNIKLHPVEFAQQIVWKLDVRLVNFVN